MRFRVENRRFAELIFEKVVEFEKQYNKHGIRVNNALQTNGYLINEAWCEFFKRITF